VIRLVEKIGVACIPLSVFYLTKSKSSGKRVQCELTVKENYVRFAFCKQDQSLLNATERLKQLK
jgi:aspartate/methionine/tyrosine aminotransferase